MLLQQFKSFSCSGTVFLKLTKKNGLFQHPQQFQVHRKLDTLELFVAKICYTLSSGSSFSFPLRVEETSNSVRLPIGGEANMSKSRHRQRVMWKRLQSRSLVLLKPENAIEA